MNKSSLVGLLECNESGQLNGNAGGSDSITSLQDWTTKTGTSCFLSGSLYSLAWSFDFY